MSRYKSTATERGRRNKIRKRHERKWFILSYIAVYCMSLQNNQHTQRALFKIKTHFIFIEILRNQKGKKDEKKKGKKIKK